MIFDNKILKDVLDAVDCYENFYRMTNILL